MQNYVYMNIFLERNLKLILDPKHNNPVILSITNAYFDIIYF